jgi:epsilon-lactone hydrolase
MRFLRALGFAFFFAVVLLIVAVRRLVRGPRLPGWGFRYEAIAELLRRSGASISKRSAGAVRASLLRSRIHPRIRPLVRHERTRIAGRDAEAFVPIGWKEGDPTILYFHGGGYVVCSPATHRDLISRIAVSSGARCLAVDYRKAPEHPFPGPIEDCLAAYREILAEVRPDDLFVGGDSAGGGLTLATLLRARDAELPLPRAAILISPWVDLECTGESIQKNNGFDYLVPEGLEWGVTHYLQGGDRRHPHVSFVHADLSGLPPLLVHTGGAELFASEHESFVAHARSAGVEVVHDVEPHMVHVWHGFASFVPECARAIERIGEFVREKARPVSQSLGHSPHGELELPLVVAREAEAQAMPEASQAARRGVG